MNVTSKTLALCGLLAFGLGGCSTVKMPNVDFLKLPQFREDAVNIKDYPKAEDAPIAPTDVRSAKEWDSAARKLMKSGAEFNAPVDTRAAVTDAEVEAEINALKEEARIYKLDDPQ